jgi:IS30 family transposase
MYLPPALGGAAMLRKEDYAVIDALKKRGVYHTDIAAELGVHPKTVSHALKRGGPLYERTGRFGNIICFKTYRHIILT